MFPFEEGYVLIDGSKTWVVDSRSPKTVRLGAIECYMPYP